MEFNIFSELKKNVDHFITEKVSIATLNPSKDGIRYAQRGDLGAAHSQRETIAAIDLAVNSTFATGKWDSEGQRKVYLNKVNFIRDVSRMRTDLDTKNFVFHPDSEEDQWGAYFMSRQFKVFVRENDYGETVNRLGDDYATYGWAVSKKVGKNSQRVPIRNLFNTQTDSLGLKHASMVGGFCGEIHEEMMVHEMEDLGWDVDGLDEKKKYKVYEQYSLVPQSAIDFYNGMADTIVNKDWTLAMQVLIPQATETAPKEGEEMGHVCFLEKIDEAPYDEARWENIDGRTMPRGPVENQLENQVATNLNANFLRKGLLHATKHLYQSQNENYQKNLVKEVRDGQVLGVGPNGLITPVATESRNMGELTKSFSIWDENTQQKGFAFEVATGAALPSGTPFRLGVILSQAVDTFFTLKRETYGLFLKRSFYSQLVPIFQSQTKEHNLAVMNGEEGTAALKRAMAIVHSNKRIFDSLIANRKIDPAQIKADVEQELEASAYLFTEVPDKFYKDVKYNMELDITDEATDTQADIESLTTLYTSMAQTGDPRSEKVLGQIFALRGQNAAVILGPKPAPQPQVNPAQRVPSNLPVNNAQNAATPQ